MLKTIVHSIISLLLISALTVSPLIPFLDKELGKTMVIGAAEEENNGNNGETNKKFDEIDAYIKYYLELVNNPVFQQQNQDHIGYLLPISDYIVEILDPPPRKLT
ncbi:MAG: hypothetical protein JJ885_06695 [Muricauda sp.]|nr:hypothetical protein [Allomuricauda sp.]MBO6533815.1 hypothetical protein [Allomuricauda sp.]MBO6587875.1 hypothetical protein [Allomuricauda sp.]MBO6617500.1 hypothetical protein [Allomuricauda sp.]MBO6643489.1 hypothetical protein [Allomuricauda sp.]MBO6745835.1 hypothetical protein [Allomuricauda sp.]